MKIIKDIPLGILVIVLSQFVFYGAMYIAKFPPFWEMVGIVFFTLISSDMITYGIKLIKGYEHDSGES